MDNTGLDDILSTPTEERAESPEQPESAEAKAERERDDKGRFVAKDTGGEEAPTAAEEPPVATPATEPAPTMVPLKAKQDALRRAQEAEARAQYLEQQLQQIQRPRQPEQPAGFWDDPDARLEQFGESLIQRWEQRQIVNRANASEAAAKAKYPDYDEVIQGFHRAAAENPRLASEMFNAPDPAEYAYRRAKQMSELAEVGDLDALKAKVRAEVEAEIRASITSTLPPTTAGTRSIGARSGPEWSGPTPLSSMIPSG